MCTRFMLLRPGNEVGALLGVDAFPETAPRYNAAPGQSLPIVRRANRPGRKREAAALRWGLVPGNGCPTLVNSTRRVSGWTARGPSPRASLTREATNSKACWHDRPRLS